MRKSEQAYNKANIKALKLRTIQTQLAWGGRPLTGYNTNLLSLFDHEFVLATGTGFTYVENSSVHTRKAFIVEPHNTEIAKIVCICAAKEGKYVAAVAKTAHEERNQLYIFVYNTHNHMQDNVKPHEIKYTANINFDHSDPLEARGIAFSPDCSLLACITNHPHIGVVVFDHFKGEVYQTIPTDALPISISFHPLDPGKICVTGECNFVKLWRFTNKSVHAAPVSNLKRGFYSYTCHNWVPPYAEGIIVVGTDGGFLSTIQNCEQRAQAQQVFGALDSYDPSQNAVAHILIRGDVVIAASVSNQIAVFEVRRVLSAKGVGGLTATLIPLAFYSLENTTRIYGLQFCAKESNTSYTLMASTADTLVFLDMITDFDLSGGSKTKGGGEDSEEGYTLVKLDKPLFNFHSKAINNLCVSTNAPCYLTFSYEEGRVRVWDYSTPNPFSSCWLAESYNEKLDDIPFSIDIHPSGLQICMATESEVKEYAVWDTHLDLIRRIPVRIPFKGTGGVPIVISQPVSLVRYSNGGHLMAVVTGKIAQIFHLYLKEEQQSTTFGNPFRTMTITDHVATITDIVFNRDDTAVYTCSSDGSVYSYTLGRSGVSGGREKEFVKKGFSATKLAISKNQGSRTIICAFEAIVGTENNTPSLAQDVVRRRRQSSIAIRRSHTQKSTSRDFSIPSIPNGSGFPSRGSADLAPALAAFLSHSASIPGSSGPPSPSPSYNADQSPPTTHHSGHHASSTPHMPTSHPPTSRSHQGPSNTPQVPAKSGFLAIWEDEISPTPTIIFLPAPCKSIALGKTHGADSFELCVIGLADGQVILSMLPIPMLAIHINSPITARVLGSTGGGGGGGKVLMVDKARQGFKNMAKRAGGAGTLGAGGMGGLGSLIEESTEERAATAGDDVSTAPSMSAASVHSTRSEEPSAPLNAAAQPSMSDSFAINEMQQKALEGLVTLHVNLAQCRVVRLVVGGVTNIAFTPDGTYVIVTGEDGSVFMLSTLRKYAGVGDGHGDGKVVSATTMTPTQFLMVDKSKMESIRVKLVELESSIEASNKDHELVLGKVIESREKLLYDLESKMKKEIATRDDSILLARKEYLGMKKQAQDEVETLKKQCQESLNSLELMYERKLAQEGVYVDKMKQAYDEYVVNMKMDINSIHTQNTEHIHSIEHDKHRALQEAEKQKHAVLQYYEYMKKRNDEVLQSLEDQQAEERSKLKQALSHSNAMLAEAQAKQMSQEVQASHAIQKLKVEVEQREVEVIRVNSDLEWANERISKLEQALQQATAELKARAELSTKWEVKEGEMQKRLDDLEKVRKTLTTQLQALQGDLVPKESALHKAAEQIQEMSREYEVSLAAISEKEKVLTHKHENMVALQKQVRDLRRINGQKDAALHRAAQLFEEYIYSLHEERFLPRSKSNPSSQTAAAAVAEGNGKNAGNGNNITVTTSTAAATVTVPDLGGNKTRSSVLIGANNDAGGNKTRSSVVVGSNNAMGNAMQAAAASVLGSAAATSNTTKTPANSNPAPADPTTDPNNGDKLSRLDKLSAPHTQDLLGALKLQGGVLVKLRRLGDVLKPYVQEGGIDAEIIDDIEAVRREQERHMSLLHRNFNVLQSSLDASQHVLHSKLTHHLHDNATLLKEVNQLRNEVKALSLENQRLGAQIEFQHARKAGALHAFNEQFVSVHEGGEHMHLPIYERGLGVGEDVMREAGGAGDGAGVASKTPKPLPSLSYTTPNPAPTHPNLFTTGAHPTSSKTAIGSKGKAGGRGKGDLAISASTPILPTLNHTANTTAQSSTKASNPPLRSFEELLGVSLDHYRGVTGGDAAGVVGVGLGGGVGVGSTVSSLQSKSFTGDGVAGTRMTADEKVAKIVELNLEEIRTNQNGSRGLGSAVVRGGTGGGGVNGGKGGPKRK